MKYIAYCTTCDRGVGVYSRLPIVGTAEFILFPEGDLNFDGAVYDEELADFTGNLCNYDWQCVECNTDVILEEG